MSSCVSSPFNAIINYDDVYVEPLILSALQSRLPPNSYKVITSLSDHSFQDTPCLQWRSYESLDFDVALSSPSTCLINSYIYRKAVTRKHYLSTTISNWIVKHPTSLLKHHYKPTVVFELDYAEFLDDALTEADSWDLRMSMKANLAREGNDREYWILKPGMSDRGQGIRLFSTETDLMSIFEGWEAEQPDSDEDEIDESLSMQEDANEKDYLVVSDLRHFIAQPYISNPLLLASLSNPPHKFHLRTYVVAVGALKVYIYRPLLALFAASSYRPPYESDELQRHLTNTCLQTESGSGRAHDGSVRLFWDLPSSVPGLGLDWKDFVFDQICAVTAETFTAASREMVTHFQPLPCAFEIFGLDFLVDQSGQAWLLEVNAFPDFKQTGEDLKDVVQGLFEEVIDVAVKPFFGIEGKAPTMGMMRQVLNLDLGRR
ncbi:tubulin-tyrosine ligase [Viridothelium virens]|uniref:Tubulin-tyrosine ligase n=1 Tax=Viridothelium virens TaxID=1048519 RepID=A0A6A6HFU2_VIRVR|nr:tubulin-tyrosine ligase [Viridothelium virens]